MLSFSCFTSLISVYSYYAVHNSVVLHSFRDPLLVLVRFAPLSVMIAPHSDSNCRCRVASREGSLDCSSSISIWNKGKKSCKANCSRWIQRQTSSWSTECVSFTLQRGCKAAASSENIERTENVSHSVIFADFRPPTSGLLPRVCRRCWEVKNSESKQSESGERTENVSHSAIFADFRPPTSGLLPRVCRRCWEVKNSESKQSENSELTENVSHSVIFADFRPPTSGSLPRVCRRCRV